MLSTAKLDQSAKARTTTHQITGEGEGGAVPIAHAAAYEGAVQSGEASAQTDGVAAGFAGAAQVSGARLSLNQDNPNHAPIKVETAIEVQNLDLYYGSFHALKDVSLTFPKNKVTALIGPSGCGKSTLLKTLNRMNDLVEGCKIEGDVRLFGADAYADMTPETLRRRVGMVFQQPNPFPMSIYDNVAFGPRTHGIKKRAELDEIVEMALRDAAIWDEVKDRLKKSALGLSGGQQQRLCIARALAVAPEVLLMDESTSALDPISTAKIEELVAELKERHTIVMVTHNMLQALRTSDKCAFFLMGELVEAADTRDMFTAPGDSRTADYVSGKFG